MHLVSFKFDIDRRTPGATGAAQQSPYSLVQEFLNRSAQHRWGFVSNGLKLDVLHDNVSLVRAANVEFDLESMFEGEVYSDFFLLFLLCHQSRVEILADDRPEECWLEKWSKLAADQGTRAREKLRVGVKRAMELSEWVFGPPGETSHSNQGCRSGTPDRQEFYRELLRDDLPTYCCCSSPRTSGWARTRTSSTRQTHLLKPAVAMLGIYSIGRLGSSRRSDGGPPTPISTSRSRSSSSSLRTGYTPLSDPRTWLVPLLAQGDPAP